MHKHCESGKRFGKTATAAGKQKLEDFIRDSDGWAFEAAYKLAGNAEQAKELVQEAMFRVIKAWDRFDGKRPLEAWFLTVLRNLFYDLRGRYEARHGVSLDAERGESDDWTLHDTLAGQDEPVEAALERQESAKRVREALALLSRDHRAALQACDMDGLDYAEAAARLRVPLGTMRSRLCRARTALRTAMGRLNAS